MHHLARGGRHTVRGSVAEIKGGAQIAYYRHFRRHSFEDLADVDRVAKVVGARADSENGGEQRERVSAVVVDHAEPIILHGLNDPAHITAREGLAHARRKQPCGGLRNDQAVCARGFEGRCIVADERSRFLENEMRLLRLHQAFDHDFGHVHQSAGQRERADRPREEGPVADPFFG